MTLEETLRGAADMFHEIVSAITAQDLLANPRNARAQEMLRDKLRSPDQLRKIAADGFELCVRALAQMGASDVTIHECGKGAIEEP